MGRSKQEEKVTQGADVGYVLAQHIARLKVCLQNVSGDSYGPEEGSDAWLLLNALTDKDGRTDAATITRFEQSGRWLAEQGGKLDARLDGLQRYVAALDAELKVILRDQLDLLVQVTERLYQLQSACVLALARGYQQSADKFTFERISLAQQLEHRLFALQRINGVSNSAIDLDQTLEITAQVVAEELRVDLCSIFFYDELQRVLTLRATNGPRPLGGMHFTLRLGEGYSGWVADKGRPLLCQDALTDQNFATEARAYPGDYHGLLSLPIIFFGNGERLIGVISIQSSEARDFTRDEMSFVEVVAGIIAINIENGRLYEQTDEQLRRKVHELATIHRVSSIIASTLNLDEVLQIITTQAVHLSGAERSCIFELDPDKQRLHVLAHHGLNSSLVSRMQIGVGQCCAGRSVQTGRPSMAVDCFHADEHCFIHNDPFISSEIHSVLCVPLKVKQKILGCICIYSSHRHLLSPEQMQLVITFANEAAIAIENARLYEETRRGLELKSVLLRELNHRVKNNLATVAGILSLQRRRTKSPEVRHILAESVNRVQGLAATHDLLAHEDVGEARVDDIARKIIGVANANLSPPEKRITIQVEPCPIVIPSRAVTILALVINEMVSNAIKHGMDGQSEGSVTIRGREDNGMVVIQVIDSGHGPSFELPLTENGENNPFEGLGLSLIKNLIGDLDGSFSLRREAFPAAGRDGQAAENSGTERTVAEVRFPLVRRSRT
ncbi:MAG TPA: GAF domain-containing protein [Ktedonobacteraceae bacterium]|jgi:GAF domain-containing protein|nr:GAF domain-containing protein [Ktedonobacteraceae bacterium]